MTCKHNWVKSGYGNDLICTKCGYAAMQAELSMPSTAPIQQPLLREKMEVPLYTGDKTVRVSVYKDEIEKQLYKHLYEHLGLDIMQGGA